MDPTTTTPIEKTTPIGLDTTVDVAIPILLLVLLLGGAITIAVFLQRRINKLKKQEEEEEEEKEKSESETPRTVDSSSVAASFAAVSSAFESATDAGTTTEAGTDSDASDATSVATAASAPTAAQWGQTGVERKSVHELRRERARADLRRMRDGFVSLTNRIFRRRPAHSQPPATERSDAAAKHAAANQVV